jgi:hypothetical protein
LLEGWQADRSVAPMFGNEGAGRILKVDTHAE